MFSKNILLKSRSHYKIGGTARYFFEAQNVGELIKAVRGWRNLNSRAIFILGDGTNVLFDDAEFDGLVLKPNVKTLKKDDYFLTVGAGVSIAELLDYAMTKGLSGLEWAGGLPGTLGGAIYGNAGCFKGEIKDIVEEVVSLDITRGQPAIIKRKTNDCDFRYRSSIFKKNESPTLKKVGDKGKEIIIEATLLFRKGDKKAIRESIEEKINYRRECQPLEYPNIGSIFKNVTLEKIPQNKQEWFKAVIKTDPFPVVPTAHLIAEAGLKGVSCGGAMISPKHPNFIVNVLDAESADVKKLIELAKQAVSKRFGLKIEEEVVIL